jgi:hypothetical protein
MVLVVKSERRESQVATEEMRKSKKDRPVE